MPFNINVTTDLKVYQAAPAAQPANAAFSPIPPLHRPVCLMKARGTGATTRPAGQSIPIGKNGAESRARMNRVTRWV